MTKRTLTWILLALATVAMGHSQSATQVLDRAVAAIDHAGGITATYTITTSQGNSHGTFAMSGDRFRMLSSEMKSWFDGHDMWSYSVATDEVNITTPTAHDLQMANPLLVARGFKQGCTVTKAKKQAPGMHTLVLVPKQATGDVKGVTLDIGRDDYRLHTVVFVLNTGGTVAIKLTDYKTGVSLPASTFVFDKSQVPAGTQVVDLR